MRIAELAPVWFTVPPTGYGGIERVVALLADGLVERGHEVTLIASGGSLTKAELVAPLDAPPDPALLGNVWYDAYHSLFSYLRADDFDVIHDHTGIIGPAIGAMLRGRPPVVHTLHGPATEPARRYYSLLHDYVSLVAISESQRRDYEGVRMAATVHNGLDVDDFPFSKEKDEFLIWVGRSNPDKGPATAVEIARRAGLPLKMLVKKSEHLERDYWEQMVAPHLTDDVEVHDNAGHDVKVDLLGRARAMVFPIKWSEPFGLVMVEAMACGTPVVTAPLGAAPELVEDGITGFLRDSVDGMVEAVTAVDTIDPHACRARVERAFSADLMVERYERLFETALGRI